VHPAPQYTEEQKQIFAFIKGIDVEKINNHMMLEWQIEQRFKNLQDSSGQPVARKKYWGELQDVSSL